MSIHELLDDPVDVIVSFAKQRVKPTAVHWGTKTYTITQVNLVHQIQEGETRIFYFSVSNPEIFMKIKFNTHTLEWRLVETYSE